jgi:hypothetical protein
VLVIAFGSDFKGKSSIVGYAAAIDMIRSKMKVTAT